METILKQIRSYLQTCSLCNKRYSCGYKCNKRQDPALFLSKLHDTIKTAQLPSDSKTLRPVLDEFAYIRNQYTQNTKFNTAIGIHITEAILMTLAYIDRHALEQGKDLLSEIQSISINYNRKIEQRKYFSNLPVSKIKDDKQITRENYPILFQYLDALKDGGYINENYRWQSKNLKNTTIKCTTKIAGFAAKSINYYHKVGYKIIETILDVKHLSQEAIKCLEEDEAYRKDIIKCLKEHNLSYYKG